MLSVVVVTGSAFFPYTASFHLLISCKYSFIVERSHQYNRNKQLFCFVLPSFICVLCACEMIRFFAMVDTALFASILTDLPVGRSISVIRLPSIGKT